MRQGSPARGEGAPHALPHSGARCRPVQPGGMETALHAARPPLAHREGHYSGQCAHLAAPESLDHLAAPPRARRRVGPRPIARRAVHRPRDTRAAQLCRDRRRATRCGAAAALPRAAQGHRADRRGAALRGRGVLAAGEPWTAGLQTAARRGQPWRAASARGGAPHRHMHMHMHVHMHMHMHVPMRWLELPTYLAGPHPLLLRGAAHACAPPSVARGSST